METKPRSGPYCCSKRLRVELALAAGAFVQRHDDRSVSGIAADELQPVGGIPFQHVVPFAEHQQVQAAGGEEELVHRVQHDLPAEIPDPRGHVSLPAVEFQVLDRDAVCLRFVGVIRLALQPFDQAGLSRAAASHDDQLALAQRRACSPAMRK